MISTVVSYSWLWHTPWVYLESCQLSIMHGFAGRLTVLTQILRSHGNAKNPNGKLISYTVSFLSIYWRIFSRFCKQKWFQFILNHITDANREVSNQRLGFSSQPVLHMLLISQSHLWVQRNLHSLVHCVIKEVYQRKKWVIEDVLYWFLCFQ